MQSFILGRGQKTGKVLTYQTGMVQARQKRNPKMAVVDRRLTISRGLNKRGNPRTRVVQVRCIVQMRYSKSKTGR